MSDTTDMTCAEVREMLPAYARDEEPSLSVRRHLARCPDCPGEIERYRMLMSALEGLESRGLEPSAGLLETLVRIPIDAGRIDALRIHVARNRRAYAGGAVVAIAGAAGAALWQARRHRLAAA